MEHTVGGQNQDLFPKCMSAETRATMRKFMLLAIESYSIHRQLNKFEFWYKFCRIYHLGRLPAIIIDVLSFPMKNEAFLFNYISYV